MYMSVCGGGGGGALINILCKHILVGVIYLNKKMSMRYKLDHGLNFNLNIFY